MAFEKTMTASIYSARQHKQKVASRLLPRENTDGVGAPHQCSRADSRLLRGISTGLFKREPTANQDRIIAAAILVFAVPGNVGRIRGQAFECDDVIGRADVVSRKRGQQAHRTEGSHCRVASSPFGPSKGGMKQPTNVLERILGREALCVCLYVCVCVTELSDTDRGTTRRHEATPR